MWPPLFYVVFRVKGYRVLLHYSPLLKKTRVSRYFYGSTCLIRLLEYATSFDTLEEIACYTSSVRQVVPPEMISVCLCRPLVAGDAAQRRQVARDLCCCLCLLCLCLCMFVPMCICVIVLHAVCVLGDLRRLQAAVEPVHPHHGAWAEAACKKIHTSEELINVF